MRALEPSLIAATAAAMVGGISVSQAVADQPERHGSYADRGSPYWVHYRYDRYDHYDPYYYDRYGYYDPHYHGGFHFGFG